MEELWDEKKGGENVNKEIKADLNKQIVEKVLMRI